MTESPAGYEVVVHGHDLVGSLEDGLLYCQQCPLVAYDLDDVATEPICPMPLVLEQADGERDDQYRQHQG